MSISFVQVVTARSATHLLVSWHAPKLNGAPITDYRLECAVHGQCDSYTVSYQGIQTSAEVPNLIPSTTYYFRVCASNSAGQSSYSEAVQHKTSASSPNAPTIESYDERASSVYLSWIEPHDNGSPITHYNIEYSDRVVQTLDNSLEWTVEHLHPETTYRFKIQAVNSIGAGQQSSMLRVTTKPLPPKPPRLECTGQGPNYLKLKWGDGRNTEFVRFYVEMFVARAKEFQEIYAGTSYLYKVNKLHEQTEYRFRVCAETDHAGLGEYSNEFVFSTVAAMPSSIKAPRILESSNSVTSSSSVDRSSITLEWQHSKNTFSDSVEYVLQLSKDRDQEFKRVSAVVNIYGFFFVALDAF